MLSQSGVHVSKSYTLHSVKRTCAGRERIATESVIELDSGLAMMSQGVGSCAGTTLLRWT